jgi:GrpB-like predicted nucleotidyltransferase (UPF0157 family)
MEKPRTEHRLGRTAPIVIARYDPSWPAAYDDESARIRTALGPTAVRVEHVGSTSVPGLGAKPVIDIQVSVPDLEDEAAFRDPLELLGYVHTPDDEAQHRFFRREGAGLATRQVHVCHVGGEWERRHLAFRDYLRADRSAAAEYERLKRGLAERHGMDIDAYIDGKAPFIRRAESIALGRMDAAG